MNFQNWLSALAVVAISLSVLACSNEQIYTAVQENQRVECGKLPQELYEQCMQELETPYEEYDQERQAILDN
tara:strand:+ start:11636 stop:11851 length:216 start_codon:yes stop_codon:yes gene_type:complete